MLVSCLARKYTNFTYMPDNASNSLSWRRLKLVRLTSPHDCGVKVNHAWYVKEQHKTHHPASEVQNSQVINKIFEGKKQNAKKLKSVKHVLDNPDPDPAWAKMTSNPAPDPKKFHNSAGSDSKNPDPAQHCHTLDGVFTCGKSKFGWKCSIGKIC